VLISDHRRLARLGGLSQRDQSANLAGAKGDYISVGNPTPANCPGVSFPAERHTHSKPPRPPGWPWRRPLRHFVSPRPADSERATTALFPGPRRTHCLAPPAAKPVVLLYQFRYPSRIIERNDFRAGKFWKMCRYQAPSAQSPEARRPQLSPCWGRCFMIGKALK
jgi:hypothetical protein